MLYSLVLADEPSVSALSAIQWLIMNFIIKCLVIVLRVKKEADVKL